MKSKKEFTVSNQPMILGLCICIIAIFTVIVLIDTLSSGKLNIVSFICVCLFIFIPAIVVALWAKMFRIQVNYRTISVRKCFGFINYKLDVSEIANIEWKITETKYACNEKISAFTIDGKKIPIETLMINSDEFIKYLEENVEPNKIHKTHIKIN